MARVKRGSATKKKHKKLLSYTKGFRGKPSKLAAIAERAWFNAGTSAYADRRKKKGQFRRLWIVRINAAVRQLGMRYSTFMDLLSKKGLDLNRKTLADLAYTNFAAFEKLVNEVKK